jgi:hypothetical protein
LVAARFNDRAFGRPTTPEEVEPLVDQAADEGILLFPEPSVHTDRMAAQQTVFSFYTVVPGGADHATAILDLVEDEASEALVRYTIRSTLKFEIRENLRQMNITAAALFPGIDGLGRSIGELVGDQFALDEKLGVHRLDYEGKILNLF